MLRFLRALLDGFLLRCPQCRRKTMFAHGFTINPTCSHCGLAFESASGEITGGMGISITATLLPIMTIALVLGLNPAVPLLPLLLGLGLFAVIFPIMFYRSARGMWIGLLYVTGNTGEQD
ncbi:MAG: DUF983 domain-containing protein [Roseiflexaceae bacterium]|nr:DUF983 domain-containing protein [Roseiflexaceae bacterium]